MRNAPAASQSQALDLLVDAVISAAAAGRSPLVVFDLDDTLFSTAARHLRILREYAGQAEVRRRWLDGAWALSQVDAGQLRYSVQDTAAAAGITDPELLSDLKAFWFKRFFANEYLVSDEPLPGAAEYCHELRRAGAHVVYMTGRDETMREGTRRALESSGFPNGQEATLMLKPRFDTPDLEFKNEAIERLRRLGAVTGAFENEPAHINLFTEAFPDALMYFLDTKHSGKPIEPHASARWIKDFRR